MKLGIVGSGRAAWAFGSEWRRLGFSVCGVSLRDGSPSQLPLRLETSVLSIDQIAASSDVILIAVPDRAIATIASSLTVSLARDKEIFHPSGSLTSALFEGHPGGFSLHPLQALPLAGEPVDLSTTLLTYEGPDPIPPRIHRFLVQLGAPLARIEASAKPAYHAAAVMAANLVASLLEMASERMARCGIPIALTKPAIAHLANSAVNNWANHENADRFTGPVVRNDLDLIERHLATLIDSPLESDVYRLLSIAIAQTLAREPESSVDTKVLLAALDAPRP